MAQSSSNDALAEANLKQYALPNARLADEMNFRAVCAERCQVVRVLMTRYKMRLIVDINR